VFFNPFFEAEPFAAITLNAYETHGCSQNFVFREIVRLEDRESRWTAPDRLKFEAEG